MRSFTIQSVSLVILRNHPDVSFRRGLKLQDQDFPRWAPAALFGVDVGLSESD